MKYLGLPLGDNARTQSFWDPMVERLEKTWALEKSQFLQKWNSNSLHTIQLIRDRKERKKIIEKIYACAVISPRLMHSQMLQLSVLLLRKSWVHSASRVSHSYLFSFSFQNFIWNCKRIEKMMGDFCGKVTKMAMDLIS